MPKKVLLIDYEPRSVERVKALLSPPDYELSISNDGEEGLAAAGSTRFDAILLSGMLPRLPSGEVIREIRRKGGATAPPIVLMMAGYKGSNPKADAQRVGAFDIVVKPFSDAALREALSYAIESTDVGARTARINIAQMSSEPALTAADIFSDVLADVTGDRPAPHKKATAARGAATEAEIERRLRDTLSGMLDSRPGVKPAAATPAASRISTTADIDRMISETLSGLTPARTRSGGTGSGAGVTPSPVAGSAPAQAPPSAAEPRPAPAPAGAIRPSEAVRPEAVPVSGSGPDRFGQYEILERIAAGGMAELYKARRRGVEGFEKIVAIKKILPHLADNEEFIAMFADEAKLAAQLNHPNIVHIYDLGKIESGGYFIAMEHVEGRDLRTILESGRQLETPLPVSLAVYVASKIASALDYAHRRRNPDGLELSVVHRDVSPQNILISFEGDIKLCDFGIAKAASKASQTLSGALKGKVPYMSPEQAWGRPIDRRSDLFSLGVVLHEMLTEQKLFAGDTDLSVLEKVRAAVVAIPSSVNPEVPKPLDAIVMKALAREPDDRYANASDMLRDLESVLYSYSPAPGSADLAIYLHRLQAEEAAAAEARERHAANVVAEADEPKRQRSKVGPIARRPETTPKAEARPPGPSQTAPPPPPVPVTAPPSPPVRDRAEGAPEVFGAFSAKPAEAERKSRTLLYFLIGVALVAAALTIWFVAHGRPGSAFPAPQRTSGPATPGPIPAPAVVTTPAPALDSKAVEEEVARQVGARKKELQKQLDAQNKRNPRILPTVTVPAAAVPAPEPTDPPEPSPAELPEPSPVPTEPPPPPTAIPRPTAAEVARGDLVGPGPGVVEPALLVPPKVVYPPLAREQRVTGRVVVLVLVDETGQVQEARLQQGIASRSGVNEAVIDAVRRAKFRPPTKAGVPVKMWRTVVVDVRP